MDFPSAVIAITGFFGFALAVLGPILSLLALKDGRDRRWVRRHPVTACATLRPGADLPRRLAIYGRTVPARGGLVTAPLSGAEGVWFRAVICAVTERGENNTQTTVLWDESGGDPFGVADETGVAAVSAQILQASSFSRDLSMWAQTRNPVAASGPSPTRNTVAETTQRWSQRGPWLQQAIDRRLVREDAVTGADRVIVSEEIVPEGRPLHVIGKPAVLPGGLVGLTLPRAGRYLVVSRAPAETEQELASDSRYGMGCAVWAVLVGAACLAICAAIAYSITP